jgi:ferric-dicitrate binding protein FerR (iron transport regulator)
MKFVDDGTILTKVNMSSAVGLEREGKTFRVINGNIEPVADFNEKNPSWMLQESSFNNIPLEQVVDELERQFDIVIATDGIDATQLFSGTFTHKDKNIALQSVTIPLKLSYKIDGKNVVFYTYEGN